MNDDMKMGLIIAVPTFLIIVLWSTFAFVSPDEKKKCETMCGKNGVKEQHSDTCTCWPPMPMRPEK
jgi:hypothetical protein